MNSSSRPGPITRLRLGWPPAVGSSSVRAVLGHRAASCSRSPVAVAPSGRRSMLRGCPAARPERGAARSRRRRHSGHDRAGAPEDLPRHRRDRLHRRAAGARLLAAGHRVRVHDPVPGTAAGPPVGRPGRDRPGRRRRRRGRSPPPAPGVDVVYYLVHALGGGPAFEETDRRTAAGHGAGGEGGRASAGWSTSARCEPEGEELSPHLRSRGEVAEILLGSGVPTAVLRAAVVLGLGLGLVRDAALPDRAAAGDGHAALGAQPDPADRRPRRAALPGRLRDAAGRRCTAASTSAAPTS